MSTGDPPDFPLGKASTQSPAQQDMDRKLQALTAEHKAQMQALTEAIEARRLLILNGELDPAVSTPEKSAGSSSICKWEKVNERGAPEVGSSSAAQGAAPAEPVRARPPPLPLPKSSGLFTGAVTKQPHSWEQRRM